MGCGLEVGGGLEGDAVAQALQQGVGEAEDAGAVGLFGVDGDAEQEADDEADTAKRQADAHDGAAAPGALGERIEVYVDDICASRQFRLLRALNRTLCRCRPVPIVIRVNGIDG